MKEIVISEENWKKLKEISEGKGIDETLSMLFSLVEQSVFPEVKFYPEELRNHMEEHYDNSIFGYKDVVKKVEIAMELKNGGLIFSKSAPFFHSNKGQNLDWAIRNKTLKNHEKRNIKNVEFSDITKSISSIGILHTEEIINSLSLSMALNLKHKDLLHLEPQVTVVLNPYFSYEYVVTFLNHDYPNYFLDSVTSDHTYKVKQKDLQKEDLETENKTPLDSIINPLKNTYRAKLAFLSKTFDVSLELAKDIKVIDKDNGKITVNIMGELETREITNSKQKAALDIAFPFNINNGIEDDIFLSALSVKTVGK